MFLRRQMDSSWKYKRCFNEWLRVSDLWVLPLPFSILLCTFGADSLQATSPRFSLNCESSVSGRHWQHWQVTGNREEGRNLFFFPLVFWQVIWGVEATGQRELWVHSQSVRLQWQWWWVSEQVLGPGAPTAALAIRGSQQPRRLTLWVLGHSVSPFASLFLNSIMIFCSYWSLGEFLSSGSCSSSNISVMSFLY